MQAGEAITLDAAIAVIAAHVPVETDEAKAARRRRIAGWTLHAEGCERRAADYFGFAAKLPKAHRDYEYYRKLAQEQMGKAHVARQQIAIEEERL